MEAVGGAAGPQPSRAAQAMALKAPSHAVEATAPKAPSLLLRSQGPGNLCLPLLIRRCSA